MSEEINWTTFYISFGSSIIVSLFTFIIGLRAGKNQTDRQRLKQSYRDLYIYLEKIKDGITEDTPLSWDNFKTEWKSSDSGYYLTPLKEKEIKGELVELHERKINKIKKHETEYLKYGNHLKNDAIKYIDKVIIQELSKEFDLTFYLNDVSDNYEYFIKQRYGNTYSPIDIKPRYFLAEPTITEICSIEIKDNQFYSFKINAKGKNKNVHVETKLFKDKNDFLLRIQKAINCSELITKSKDEKKKLLKICKKDLAYLKKRVRDPHTVFNTLINAFLDIFRL